MNARLFRLLEKHQRVDEALRREQRAKARDLRRLQRLEALKRRVKQLINRMILRAARA